MQMFHEDDDPAQRNRYPDGNGEDLKRSGARQISQSFHKLIIGKCRLPFNTENYGV
jgi:hypothetical protein